MSTQPISRHRKQHFPRLERRKLITPLSSSQTLPLHDYDSDDDPVYMPKHPTRSSLISTTTPTTNNSNNPKPFRSLNNNKIDCKDPSNTATTSSSSSSSSSTTTGRPDKRARDEHNEQERSRRRELAVIYELIRCSFTNDDLRYLGQCNGPKSIDKLSYPQVLQIAYQLIREEQHNLTLFEKSLNDLKVIEKEFVRVGLPVPERPKSPYILDTYRKMIQLVDNLLRHDKLARSIDGVYEVTPAERAAIGDQELSFLLPRSHHHHVHPHHHQHQQHPHHPHHTSTTPMTDYSHRLMKGRKLFNFANRSNYTENYLEERDDTVRNCFSTNWSTTTSGIPTKFKRSSSSASLDYAVEEEDTDSNLLPPTPPPHPPPPPPASSTNRVRNTLTATAAAAVPASTITTSTITTTNNNNNLNTTNSSSGISINNHWLDDPEYLDILSKFKDDPHLSYEFDTTPIEELDDDDAGIDVDVDVDGLLLNFVSDELLN